MFSFLRASFVLFLRVAPATWHRLKRRRNQRELLSYRARCDYYEKRGYSARRRKSSEQTIRPNTPELKRLERQILAQRRIFDYDPN